MTAEIAVLNRSAVALAADSAVTITTHSGQKIYNTVNKLFTLSKYEPIGVMVNGTADLMSVPWELIIKLYRREIDDMSFGTVENAADHFLGWVRDEHRLFPTELREEYALKTVGSFFAEVLKEELGDAVRLRLQTESLTDEQVGDIVDEQVRQTIEFLEARDEIGWCSPATAASVMKLGSDPLDELISVIFENLPMSSEARSGLEKIARLILHKDFFGNTSGLVVSGYGRDEAYPALCRFDLDGLVADEAKFIQRSHFRIGHDGGASIQPFAQREMVDTFIAGIAPDYGDALDGFLAGFFEELPQRIGEGLSDPTVRSEVETTIAAIGAAAHQHFGNQLRAYTQERFVSPIVSAVEVLPKEELAEMAEALVNLTSFKRRVSLGEVETVGGPIDVAVISKGDGFVWIKRKHYFQPELNPQFFANYYR